MTAAELRARAARLCDADVRAAWNAAVAVGQAAYIGQDDQTPEAAIEDMTGEIVAIFGCALPRLLVALVGEVLMVAAPTPDGPMAADLHR